MSYKKTDKGKHTKKHTKPPGKPIEYNTERQ